MVGKNVGCHTVRHRPGRGRCLVGVGFAVLVKSFVINLAYLARSAREPGVVDHIINRAGIR